MQRDSKGRFKKGNFKDYTGIKKNRLTFMRLDHIHTQPSGGKVPYWELFCECGSRVVISAQDVMSGHTKSCGCYQKERASESNSTHRKTKTRLYRIWENMKKRCMNENTPKHKNYGARGITIADEWLNFGDFEKWAMNNGYGDKLTIERINVNGNYEPSNCEWIALEDQAKNRTNTHVFLIDGKKYSTSELSEYSGLKPKTILARYYRGDRGLDLIRPLGQRNKKTTPS